MRTQRIPRATKFFSHLKFFSLSTTKFLDLQAFSSFFKLSYIFFELFAVCTTICCILFCLCKRWVTHHRFNWAKRPTVFILFFFFAFSRLCMFLFFEKFIGLFSCVTVKRSMTANATEQRAFMSCTKAFV